MICLRFDMLFVQLCFLSLHQKYSPRFVWSFPLENEVIVKFKCFEKAVVRLKAKWFFFFIWKGYNLQNRWAIVRRSFCLIHMYTPITKRYFNGKFIKTMIISTQYWHNIYARPKRTMHETIIKRRLLTILLYTHWPISS